MPFTTVRLRVPRNTAMKFNVGDKVRATVLGEITEVEAMMPIGEGLESTDVPSEVPGGSVSVDVSVVKIRKRAPDEMEEEFAKMGLDEDEEED